LVEISALIEGIPTVDRRRRGAAGAAGAEVDVAIMLGAEADVLLDDAPLGVWTYRHGLGRERADDVPYLRDVTEKRLASHVALVRQPDQVVLAHSTIRTDLVSMQRVRSAALLRCRHLAGRLLRDLRDGAEPVAQAAAPETVIPPRPLGVVEVLSSVARIPLRVLLRRLFNALWHEQWLLVVRPVENLTPPPISFAGARLHRPPRGRDWADPFPLRVDGRSWLFFEEIPWRGGRGHISVAELDEDGDLHDQRIVLATPHHLSYPFVFVHDDDIYLLPESRASSATTLYRAREFPDHWEPLCVLADEALYDPTPFHHDGTWWLFGTTADLGESQDDELHLFHADRLEGPWHAHPRNPVVSDVRGARPAGPLIRHGSRLLRPAQDCSGRYGRAVVFKEVIELSRSAYREVEVARLDPDWLVDNLATHHYASGERWTATDAMLRRRRW
jgi:hypothetical protein